MLPSPVRDDLFTFACLPRPPAAAYYAAAGLRRQPPGLEPYGPPAAAYVSCSRSGGQGLTKDKVGSSLASSYSLLTIYGGLFFFRI